MKLPLVFIPHTHDHVCQTLVARVSNYSKFLDFTLFHILDEVFKIFLILFEISFQGYFNEKTRQKSNFLLIKGTCFLIDYIFLATLF